MNIDRSLVRQIIRISLEDSRSEGISDEKGRAIYHALKAMNIMCKDQPLIQNVKVLGTSARNLELERSIKLMMEPDFAAIVSLLPEMVEIEMSDMKGSEQ